MEGPISFGGYKEQESNLILPEHDDEVRASSYIQINQPTRCINLSDLLSVV